MERLERRIKSFNDQPFQGSLLEKTDSEESIRYNRASNRNLTRSKLNSTDSSDSMAQSNGKLPETASKKNDEGLGESLEQDVSDIKSTTSVNPSKSTTNGIVNPAYEAVAEESELTLDPSKLKEEVKQESLDVQKQPSLDNKEDDGGV